MGPWPSTSQPTHASTPAFVAFLDFVPNEVIGDVTSRDELLAEAAAPEAVAIREAMMQFFDLCDTEEVAPSAGLTTTTREFTSQPDGNTIKLQVIRPDTDDAAALRLLHPRRRHGRACRASTACTAPGGASSPPTASPS